jgi:hypothetical protein
MTHAGIYGSQLRTAVVTSVMVLAGTVFSAGDASAVSTKVKLACAKDYYAHCSKHAPNSPEVRECMRSVGEDLSPRCINALVAEGEVSPKEVAEHTK